MALGNVPKLHGLVGILAAVCALPVGCSDEFEGCAASRTCPPKDDGGEAGNNGDTGGTSGSGGASGGTTNTGGRSGSGAGGGSSGAAGSDDGGNGGDGGSGGDDVPPTIVSFSPGDGDSDVERDVAVTATFSEPIDEASVTGASVTLLGPDGAVTGTLSVDDNVISFVPDKPLNLLGTYTVTVNDTVADLAGNTLAQNESAEFQARDGRWSEPTFPFGTTLSRVATQFRRNALGDVVLGMEVWPDDANIFGAVYNAETEVWTAATELRAAGGTKNVMSVGIDAERRAAIAWEENNGATFGWSRYTQENGWSNSGSLGGYTFMGVTNSGLATVAWKSSGSFSTRTQDLSDGSIDPDVPSPLMGNLDELLASLDRLVMLGVTTTSESELRLSWKEGSSWGEPQLLASATEMSYAVADSDEQGNVIVVWREGAQIWSRVYDRAANQWTPELFVANTTVNGLPGSIDMTAGNAIFTFRSLEPEPATWAAVYESGVGWLQNSVVRLESLFIDGVPAVVIDKSGNALAAWRSNFRFQRYIAGQGWLSPQMLDSNVSVDLDEYSMWAAAAPDGTALVVGNQIQSATDQAPWAIRFE